MRELEADSTSLLTATFNGDLKETLRCIAAGANVNVQDPTNECTPLFYAVERGSVEIVAALLSTRRVDHELWDSKDQTPLDRAKALRTLFKNADVRDSYDKIAKMIDAYDVPSPSMAPAR